MRSVNCFLLSSFLLLFCVAQSSEAQQPRRPKPKQPPEKTTEQKLLEKAGPLQLLGIRPGLTLDSLQKIMLPLGIKMREVSQDTLTHCFADQSIKILIVDSIFCRLTYMRMCFLVESENNRLRRFTITPRESSINLGKTDDVNEVLLLYFGQQWGNPDISFFPPAYFKWRLGNIEAKGFIKRGYPLWVMEG